MGSIVDIKKFKSQTNDVIVIDGLWGTGKSLLSPIISGMDRVENTNLTIFMNIFVS